MQTSIYAGRGAVRTHRQINLQIRGAAIYDKETYIKLACSTLLFLTLVTYLNFLLYTFLHTVTTTTPKKVITCLVTKKWR